MMKQCLYISVFALAFVLSSCATWEKGVTALAPMVVPEDQQLFCQGVNQLLTGEPTTDLDTLLREDPESPWSAQARKVLALSDELKRLEATNAKLTTELVDSRAKLADSQKKQATQARLLRRQKQYIQKLKDLIVDSEIQQIK